MMRVWAQKNNAEGGSPKHIHRYRGIMPIPPAAPPATAPPLLVCPKLKLLLLLRCAVACFFVMPEAALLLPGTEGFLGLLGFLNPPRSLFGLLS